jgi:hypothetical protein
VVVSSSLVVEEKLLELSRWVGETFLREVYVGLLGNTYVPVELLGVKSELRRELVFNAGL